MQYLKKWLIVFIISLTAATWAERPIGIIGALDEEIQMLDAKLTDKKLSVHLGIKFHQGKLNGRSVVILKSGMGKVNASMSAALLLDRFDPAVVIFTGIAGGIDPNLQPGDIVIGEKLIQYDYGIYNHRGFQTGPSVNPITDKPNPLFLQSAPELVILALTVAHLVPFENAGTNPNGKVSVVGGIIASGDAFIASTDKSKELRRAYQARAVEMEGAAIAQVCTQADCPFIIIRCLSDSADNMADADLVRFLKVSARNSAMLAEAMVQRLPAKNAPEK